MRSLLFLLLAILALSCETVIPIDIETQEGALVINGTLKPGRYLWLDLSESADPLDDTNIWNPPTIYDALIDIYEVDANGNSSYIGSCAQPLTDNDVYTYQSADSVFFEGRSYRVEVSLPDGRSAIATTELPVSVTPTSFAITDTVSLEGKDYVECKLVFTDPELVDNRYSITLAVGTGGSSGAVCFRSWEPDFVRTAGFYPDEAAQMPWYCETTYFRDTEFQGRERTITTYVPLYYFIDLGPEDGDVELYAFLNTPSLAHYEHAVSSRLQDITSGNPFAQPAAVYSNVEGGLGVFTGLSSQFILAD